jgi:outer membrane murein-binding lipoprotein Lpp
MLRNGCKVVLLLAVLGSITLAGCGSKGNDGEATTPQSLDQELNAKIQSVRNDPDVPADQKEGVVQQIKQEYADRKAQVAGQK